VFDAKRVIFSGAGQSDVGRKLGRSAYDATWVMHATMLLLADH